MMTRRTAITRHNRRINPHGLPATALVADQLPLSVTAAAVDDAEPLLIPGMRPPLEPLPVRLPRPLRRRSPVVGSAFVRRDLAAAADSALRTFGVLGAVAVVVLYLTTTYRLGELLHLAASAGGLQ